MALVRIDHQPSGKNLGVFAAVWLVFFAGWGCWFGFRSGWDGWAYGFLGLSVVAPLVGLVSREGLRLIYLGACYAAFPIGFVISHILLGIVYYGVMTPIGLMMRIVGYDPMHRKPDSQAETYWVEREPPKDKQQYFRQF